MTAWIQLSLVSDADNLERVEEAFTEAGALAVTLISADTEPLIKPSADAALPWSKVRVVGLFDAQTDIESVQDRLRLNLGCDPLPDCHIESLGDQDWPRKWMDYFRPMRFGRRLWVCPTSSDPPDPSAINIFLDPGQAFGTGTHPTTALCLEWIDGANLQGLDVIDYGCGSGILAIAAAKSGARHVWAVDNDPQALLTAQENASRNGVSSRVFVIPPEAIQGIKADVILANILANPLRVLVSHFAGLLRQEGIVVLSGFLKDQVDGVVRVYAPWFDIISCVSRDQWVRLEGRCKDV